MSKLTKELLAVVTLAGALVGWQLFVPPIVGLADQGDFVRVLGPLGYAPQPKGVEHEFVYVVPTYVWDPSYRQPKWEDLSSELPLLRAILFFNRLFGHAESFNILLIGAVHAGLFLLAFFRLCQVTRTIRGHTIVWLAAVLMLTDVGYVAYWNSLYTEPASCLWFLFLLSESIGFCTSAKISTGSAARWSIFAVLWTMAKAQNAPLCLPLAIYSCAVAWRTSGTGARRALLAGAVAVLAAGTVMYRSRLPAIRMSNLYNMVFYAILPESHDPAGDLKLLHLNPDYAKYSGTLPWSPNTGVADGKLIDAVMQNVTPFTIVRFYLQHPRRLLKHLKIVLRTTFSLRPDFCGNFEKSAGKPAGARTDSFSLWSRFRARWFPSAGLYLVASLLLAPAVWIVVLIRNRKSLGPDILCWSELGISLLVYCAMSFFAAAFGDAWDIIKHQFQFNLLLDTSLLFALAVALQFAYRGTYAVRARTLRSGRVTSTRIS